MAILTFEEIARRSLLGEMRLIKAASDHATGKRVFLSYSSLDRRYVAGVVDFFADFGAPVYVDKDDAGLPDPPSLQTAKTLADNITICPKVVVLVSPASRASRWVPWELGLAHGTKGLENVSTLSIGPADQDAKWSEREYLALYPRIERGSLNGQQQWYVVDPRDGKAWTMRNWLFE